MKNMKVFAGLKDEWDFDKNRVPFDSISPDSQLKYWWKCQKCGYSSIETINERLKGRRCRQCMLRENAARMAIPLPGESLGDLFPGLVNEWDEEKNSGLDPFSVKPNSMKKVWWKCQKCGNKWQANIPSRSRGAGCPACWESRRGKTISMASKEDSLATLYPEIAEEWNYEKNGELIPEHVYPKSNKKVWWRCKHNHEWESRIASRVNGSGCPICRTESHSSFPEQALFWYLSRDYSGVVENRHKERINNKNYEIDVFIPEQRIAIEYDGEYWHKGKKN